MASLTGTAHAWAGPGSARRMPLPLWQARALVPPWWDAGAVLLRLPTRPSPVLSPHISSLPSISTLPLCHSATTAVTQL